MPELLSIHDSTALDAAETAVVRELVIVVPTDTVYGLAALPGSPAAVERLYVLKDRPESVPIAMLVASPADAHDLAATVSPAAQRLMDAFWPGPLTIVLATGDGTTVGVRCPDHEFMRALTARTGPLAVTSANRHGEPTPAEASAASAALAGEVALVVDGGPCTAPASTVVDGTDPDLPVLREGGIRRPQIVAAALR
jgi:tRNA threonylcarbamoyl adenosine modification protein (Sua5/YciO/YrdC/YwlC family)